MATKILLKKSSTAGAVPLTTDLEIGEVALNLADRKLYTKNNSNTVIPIGSAYVGGTAPTAPAEGDLWYDSTNDLLNAYNGTAWAAAGYTSLTQFGVNASAAELNILDGATLTTTELNYVDGVTSAIQTQLDGKSSTSHNHTIDSLSNVVVTSNSDNEVLAWDSATSKWINQTAAEAGLATAAHNHTLDSLSNVTITSNASGEILKWNGTAWVNNTLAEAGIAAASHTHTAANITDFNEAAQDAVGAIISGAGIASVAYNDVANTIVVTATEADTLATVTGRGATTATAVSVTNTTASSNTTTGALIVSGGVGIGGNLNVGGNTTITGNLTVSGTTTTVNSNTVNIGDNIIVLNSDETAAASQNAGFEVERGTDTNVQFIWHEGNDAWDMGDYPLQNVKLDGGTY